MPLMSKFEFDERLRSLQMEVLDENRSFLCETITPSRHYPYLRQVKVLSKQSQETIESKATSTAKANAFIDELQSNGGPKAFTAFLEALLKDGTQSHVISKLNRDLEAKRDTPDVRDAIHQSHPHEPPPGERRLERVPTEDDDIDTINSPLSSLESASFDPEPPTRPEFTPPTMPSFGILSNLTTRVSLQDGPTLIPHGNSNLDTRETGKLSQKISGDFCTAAEKRIDHQGGTVRLPDVDVALKIPQGALQEPTPVSLSVQPYKDHPLLEADQLIFGPVISCKPDDLTFLKPVTISLPHSGVNINARCLQVWSKNSTKHSSWEKIYDGASAEVYQDNVSVVVEGNNIKFRVKHFTLFDVVTVPVSMIIGWLKPAMTLDMYAYMGSVDVATAKSVRLRVYAIKRSDVTSRKMMEEEERGNSSGRCCIPWCFVLKQNGNNLQVTTRNIRPADKWILDPDDAREDILYAHIQAGGTGSRCEIKIQPRDDTEQADWLEGSLQTAQDGNPDTVQRTYFDDSTAQRNRGQHGQELPVCNPNEPEDIPTPCATSDLRPGNLASTAQRNNRSTRRQHGQEPPVRHPNEPEDNPAPHASNRPANLAPSSKVVSLFEHCSIGTGSSESGASTLGDTGPFLKTVARKIEPKWREVATTLEFSADQCEEFEGGLSVWPWWPTYKMLLAWQTKIMMSPCDFKQLQHILADAIRPLDEQLASQIIGNIHVTLTEDYM